MKNMIFTVVGFCVLGLLYATPALGQAATDVNCDGCVHTGDIATNGVRRADIQNFAVNTPKLNNFAVTTAKIKTGAVTADKIADGAVTAAKLDAMFSAAIGTACSHPEVVVGIDETGNLVCELPFGTPPYYPSGPQLNVAPSELVGWKECYRSAFNTGNVDTIDDVLAACSGSQIMLACKPVADANLTLLAAAPRDDVLFDTFSNVTRFSNGSQWYFNDGYSWGFANGGDTVNRSTCDFDDGSQTNTDLRMCMHTGNGTIQSGYRCGNNSLNSNADWERVFYTTR